LEAYTHPPKPPVVSYADFQGQLMEVEYSYTTITIDETGKPEVTHSSSKNGLYISGDWHSVKHDVYRWGIIGEGATKRAIYVRILLFPFFNSSTLIFRGEWEMLTLSFPNLSLVQVQAMKNS
jgi:hypothetical protein